MITQLSRDTVELILIVFGLVAGGVVVLGYLWGLFRGDGLARARKEALDAQAARIEALDGDLSDAHEKHQRCLQDLRLAQGKLEKLEEDRELVRALAMGERVPPALRSEFEGLATAMTEGMEAQARAAQETILQRMALQERAMIAALQALRGELLELIEERRM